MTVNDLWEETKSLLRKPSVPGERFREVLSELIKTTQGRERFIQELKGLEEKPKLLGIFARMMEPSEAPSSNLEPSERIELLKASVKAARGLWRTDATYWMLLWLLLKSGEVTAPAEAAKDLKRLTEEGRNPNEYYARIKGMLGWADFTQDRWLEIIDKVCEIEQSREFRECMQILSKLIRDTGGKSNRPLAATTMPAPAPLKVVTAVEIKPPQGSDTKASTGTGTSPKIISSPVLADVRQEPDVEKRSEPRSQTAEIAARLPESRSMSAPIEVRPEPNLEKQPEPGLQTPVDTAILPESGSSVPAEMQPELSEEKSQPHRPPSKKKTRKQGPVALPNQIDAQDESKLSSDPSPQVRSGREIPAVLTELVSAVRLISDRIDHIAGRTGEQASQGQKLGVIERKVAELERALSEVPAQTRRTREEAEKLGARIHVLEEELRDAKRERDEAMARADGFHRKFETTEARIKAAEKWADQNIHSAHQERDAAVLTFKGRLWTALRAQLSDVTDPIPGERFASTLEKVLTTRLRIIRQTLQSEGVPP